MKILFQGFYGFKNSGDDAFVEVSAWGARKYWNTKNNLFLGNNLPEVVTPIQSLGKPLFTGYNRLQTGIHAINADYFISAGGSTFSDNKKYSLKHIATIIKNSFNKKLRVGAIGVSVGPFKTSQAEQNVINLLKQMDFIALRDRRSYEFISALNLPYKPVEAFDLAALLPNIYQDTPASIDKPKKVIGISVCNYERYINGNIKKEKQRNSYLLELISSLPYDESVVFRFFIFNGHSRLGDQELTQSFVDALPSRQIEVIPYQTCVKKTWDLISTCSVVISTRLHASIFACYANVPFFLIEYHQKCSDFLIDVGQNEKYRLYDAEKNISDTVQEISNILYKNEHISPLNVKETIKKSRRNFTDTITI